MITSTSTGVANHVGKWPGEFGNCRLP